MGRFLKVECIAVLDGEEFGPIFAISKAVLSGITSSLFVVYVIRDCFKRHPIVGRI